MNDYVNERRFKNSVVSGLASVAFIIVFVSIAWPIWSTLFKKLIMMIAGAGLVGIDEHLVGHYVKDVVEGSYFWLVINSWVWFTLIFGNYGKYKKTNKQPQAGFRYLLMAFGAGILGFVVFTGFLGTWWKPFSWAILFTPKTPEEVELAIKGWGCTNFYALTIIITQLPFVSIFHKFPFAKNIKEPWVGFGTMAISTAATLLVWFAIFVPSYFKFTLDGVLMVEQPFGTYTAFLAWCQCFVFLFLFPAEGGENFPMKLFAKKQPYMGFVGIAIAYVGSFILLGGLRIILAGLAESMGMGINLVVASFALTLVCTLLTWHHVFFDFPGTDLVASSGKRALIRLAIVFVVGSVVGVIWLKTYTMLPFAGNNFGMGYPMLGILAGQFVYLAPLLIFNTYFDKCPIGFTQRKKEEESVKAEL
ncbi:hypothetical protein SH2C18_51130 [Clostridium sediminicola]|uniref:hypothetical protein n=1 Tax=Clostridium sediminicola TaxID=3114879 RepID=UPI0031F25E68